MALWQAKFYLLQQASAAALHESGSRSRQATVNEEFLCIAAHLVRQLYMPWQPTINQLYIFV